jgi:acyl-CoA hydrolase
MEVGIRVVTENIQQRLVRHANSCYFTMVAVDKDRKPLAVPMLVPDTEERKARFEEAKLRKAARQQVSVAKKK